MSDKPNAMELLEQASRSLTDARFNAMQDPLSAGKQAMVDGWAELRSRIDAYLAAPSESAIEAERETAALRDLVRRMRIAGNMVRDAMPNSVAVHNWIDVCAEADKVLGETTP